MWPGRDGESASVRPDAKSGGGVKNVHLRSGGRAGGTEWQTERRKRQLEPVKFGFNRRAFLSVTRVHRFQSPSCHTVVSNKSSRCGFKAVFQPDCGSRAHLWCVRSFSWPLNEICKVSQSLYFHSFFISKMTTKKGYFKYIYICVQVHVCFHSGQMMTFYSKTLSLSLFSNVYEDQVSQCNVSGRNHPQQNIPFIWSSTCNYLLCFFCLFQLHKALATF